MRKNQELVLKKLDDQERYKIINIVSSLFTCVVAAGVCGFLYITRLSFHPGSVILKFILLYPANEISETKLVEKINKYFIDGRMMGCGQFELDIVLVDNNIKGELIMHLSNCSVPIPSGSPGVRGKMDVINRGGALENKVTN